MRKTETRLGRATRQTMQQSAAQLHYRLLAGETDLRPLRILASRELAWGAWTARICVLGASHAVELRRGGECLAELLTCAPPSATTASTLADLAADAPGSACGSAHGLICRVAIEPFSLLDGDALRTPFDEACRMSVTFPAEHATAPVTRIGWRVGSEALMIETVHSYPEEGRGVRSLSLFQRGESGP
jgi:hypothetical protein